LGNSPFDFQYQNCKRNAMSYFMSLVSLAVRSMIWQDVFLVGNQAGKSALFQITAQEISKAVMSFSVT